MIVWVTLLIITLFTIFAVYFFNSKNGGGDMLSFRYLADKDKTPTPKPLPPPKGIINGGIQPPKGSIPLPPPPKPLPPPPKGIINGGYQPPKGSVPLPRPPPPPPKGIINGGYQPPKGSIPLPKPVPIPRPPPPQVPIPRPPPPQPKPVPIPRPVPQPKPVPIPRPVPLPKPVPLPRPQPHPVPIPKPLPHPVPKPNLPPVPPNWYKNPPAWYKIPPAYKPPSWFRPLLNPPPRPGVAWLPPYHGPRPVFPIKYIYNKPQNLPSYLRWWNPTKYGGYVPGMYDSQRWRLTQAYINEIRAGRYPRGYMPLYPEYMRYYQPIPGWTNPYEGKYVPIPYYLYKQFGFDYGYDDDVVDGEYGETLFIYSTDECPYDYTKICDGYNQDPSICRCVENGTIDPYTNQIVGQQPIQPIRPYIELPPGGRRSLEEVQQMWASIGCTNVNFPATQINGTWFTSDYNSVIADMQRYQQYAATNRDYYNKCYGTTSVPNNPVEIKLGAQQCPPVYYTVECKAPSICKANNWNCRGGCKCIRY